MASLLPRARALAPSAASASASLARAPIARALSTTSPARAFGKEKDFIMNEVDAGYKFGWDESSSMGYLRLLAMEDLRAFVAKMYTDTEALNARPFTPPAGKIRVTTQIDLAAPESPYNHKHVLVAPVSALPLKDDAAVRRLQLLAGPRWTPGPPGRGAVGPETTGIDPGPDGKLGFIKIAEERYPASRMNRKSVSDMLERLVAAANDPKSPIPADTPVDASHILARQRKQGGFTVYARREALKRRNDVVGGVRGFPKEWLSPEAQAKLA